MGGRAPNPSGLDTLAAAYASAGRFDDAVRAGERAVEAARASGKAEWVGDFEARIDGYREGRPFRMESARGIDRESMRFRLRTRFAY